MSHQSYRDGFVVNNPTLLKSGISVDLGVGQLGIFTADPEKDQVAVYPPNYNQHRIIQLIQGTPDLPTNYLAAVSNQNDRSKPIKGKKILSWRGRKAERGQSRIVALGYDGIDTTKTLFARCEETKTVFIKLSGGPIDEVFHTEGKGFVRQFSLYSGCCDDCGDDCAFVSASAMADDLVRQINEDPVYGQGTQGIGLGTPFNKLIKARKVTNASLPAADATCERFILVVCDDGTSTGLGLVQGQYPGKVITRLDRAGSVSTYELIQPDGTDPAAYNNSGIVTISDCPVCPSGYTLSVGGYAYQVKRVDAGSAGNLTTLKSDYGISSSNEVGNRVAYEFGQSTYVIVSATAISSAVGTDLLTFVGQTSNTCVLTTPSTIAWSAAGIYNKYNKKYRITVKDNVCGTSRLTEIQAAYPSLTVTQIATGAVTCTHRFETTVQSDCVPPGCPADAPKWIAPAPFQGIVWDVVADAAVGSDVKVGVIIEPNYVDRPVTERAYDYWSFENEPIYIEVSQHSHDYNDKPTICAGDWVTTVLQEIKLPIGNGAQVMKEEEFFKGYRREYRDLLNPIVNELQNSVLQADPKKYYDQYSLEFQFEFNQGWFSEKLTDSYILEIYVPEGTGKELEAAINGYISSAPIDLLPVVL